MNLALKIWYQGCQFGWYAMQVVANSKMVLWTICDVDLQYMVAKNNQNEVTYAALQHALLSDQA